MIASKFWKLHRWDDVESLRCCCWCWFRFETPSMNEVNRCWLNSVSNAKLHWPIRKREEFRCRFKFLNQTVPKFWSFSIQTDYFLLNEYSYAVGFTFKTNIPTASIEWKLFDQSGEFELENCKMYGEFLLPQTAWKQKANTRIHCLIPLHSMVQYTCKRRMASNVRMYSISGEGSCMSMCLYCVYELISYLWT